MGSRYVVDHLNHLGIVAEVCGETGVAAWLNQQEVGCRQQVSVGTATVALVLNGLGFSHRQSPIANRPVSSVSGASVHC
jgi:hypothetical protein